MLVARWQRVLAGSAHPTFDAANTISDYTDVNATNADDSAPAAVPLERSPTVEGGAAEHAPTDVSVPDAAAASAKTRVVALLIALALSLFILSILSGMCRIRCRPSLSLAYSVFLLFHLPLKLARRCLGLSLAYYAYAATQAKNGSNGLSVEFCDAYRAYWDFQPSDSRMDASADSAFSCGWPSWQSGVRLAACVVALIAAVHFAVAVWRSSAAPSVCLCVHAPAFFSVRRILYSFVCE